MLVHLDHRASDRKFRLFAIACCKRVGCSSSAILANVLADAEQFADGLISGKQLRSAARGMREAGCYDDLADAVACATMTTTSRDAWVGWGTAELAAAVASRRTSGDFDNRYPNRWEQERARQADLARDIFGNRLALVTVDSACLSATVTSLAQAIYDDRAFDRLPILADALEDAGCTNQDILAHCRGGGEHARGCWVVDLLLGKT
jgi:hypothetical protein